MILSFFQIEFSQLDSSNNIVEIIYIEKGAKVFSIINLKMTHLYWKGE